MPEPLFGAAFFVGILGNLLARHIDPAARSAAEAILSRLTSTGELPPNHDLDRVCRASLRQALELMAQSMDLHVVQPQNLNEAFHNRFDAQGKWKPMVEWWHTAEREWFLEFIDAIASDDALADFDLRWVKGAASLNDPLRSKDNPALEKLFSESLLAWTELQVQKGTRPKFFESWVREGWPVAQDSPSVRISIFPAWCLFLQQHFKDDEKVRAILTADWLASIDERLRNLPLSGDEISGALKEPLGEQLKMLTELRDQVRELAAGLSVVNEGVGQMLAIVLEFRSEVGTGFSSVRAQLAALQTDVAATGIAARSADRKLDTSLLNDTTILTKLDELLARSQHPSAPAAVQTPAVHKRIADSRLLASDGAARLKRLVGRAPEKGLLTRAWKEGNLRVISFVAWGGAGKTSLIVDWLKDHLKRRWEGVDAFFDWSFYSQGTKEQSSASSDIFFSAALRHFGEDALAESATPVEEKASRLVAAMKRQRTLLVLDGLEPLQHPRKPGQEEGRLKDNGLARLLRLLAQSPEPVLCIVTTRVPVVDIHAFRDSTVQEIDLDHLSVRHGAELLHLAGAQFAGAAPIDEDDRELLDAAREVAGHAMTLQMLGGYLRSAQEGDIRRRDRVDFDKAFDDQLEGHTYNVMEAYEQWFEAEGDRGRRQLAVLRMMGLFDRVADAGCIAALRKDGGVPGVSDAVARLSEADWNDTLQRLSDHHLVTVNRTTHALDAHPLLREYFARRVREGQPEAWRAAHRRLYEHLCASTHEGHAPTLEDLQPLYQAVAHGCQAGLQQEACDKVYIARIKRGKEHYSSRKLGAFGSDLGAVACFFEQHWNRLSPALIEVAQAFLLNEAAFRLRALGRLPEALVPMRTVLNRDVWEEAWKEAAVSSRNLSELELTLGEVAAAVRDAEQPVTYADRSGEWGQQVMQRASHADALHQAGRRVEAETRFREAEQTLQEMQPEYPLLYSLPGFGYCDLLLATPERAAWQVSQRSDDRGERSELVSACRAVAQRAAQTLKWDEEEMRGAPLLDFALHHLTLGRAELYAAILESRSDLRIPHSELDAAVTGLRRAGQIQELPRGLLTRAWLRCLEGKLIGHGSAREDLDEAWEIAERGPMRLHMADIHLHRARLFHDKAYPREWISPEADLAAAEKLINSCGYHRRDEELADAKRAVLGS